MAPCTGGSPDDGSIGLPIDLTDTRQPLRRATIFVQAWPKEGREAAQLELTSFDATTADLEAKLVEAGYGKYRLRQMHYGNLEPPPARFSFVRALQPAPRKSKASGGGAAALSGPAASPSSRVPPGARPRETIKLSLPPSFDMLAKVVAPEFTTAQGIKEIIDNAIQSLVFFDLFDLTRNDGWVPQIVIIIDLERERLRIVDNGGGLNPQQMIDWAECGNSTNRSRVTEMLEADANDPRVVGLFSQLFSSYGIGGKGGAGALTRAGKEIHGNLTLFSCQGVDEDGVKNLQKINFDLKEAQRRQGAKDDSPWNRDYTPSMELSDEPELQSLMTRTGWGERITCLEVENLSPAVLSRLRDIGSRQELLNEIVETWEYSFDPRRYDEIASACETFSREKCPRPLRIQASVEVYHGGSTPTMYDINARAAAKYERLTSQPSVSEPSTSQQPRRGGLRGGDVLETFCHEFELTDGPRRGRGVLHLTYHPFKEGAETLPEGCVAGFDVRWQSRLLKDEGLRHLSFMDPGKLSSRGHGGSQKETKLLLDRVGHRVCGVLLLDGNFAVNKMKSELLRTGEESSSGSVRLVQCLSRQVTDWEYPGGHMLIDRYLLWLKGCEKLDDNYRFLPSSEGGDVEAGAEGGYVSKVVRIGVKTFKAPRSEHGCAAQPVPLRLLLRKDMSRLFDKKTNAVWAVVSGFLFDAPAGLDNRGVAEACKAATDGYVLFHAEGAAGAAKLQKLPLAHIELKENGAGGIPEKAWRAHVKSHEQALKRMKPSKVISAPEIATTSWSIVREDTHLALEDAHRGNVAQDTALWLAVHVLNHDHKVMKSDELRKGGFLIRLTAQHRPSGREVIISSSHLLAGDVAWLQPTLDEPGEWVCTVAVVDGATVMGSPWHVTLTVAAAVCCVELQAAFEEEEDQTLRLGEPLPPLVLTALDVVGGVFELPQSAAGLQFDVEVTWQPSGQQNLRIDTAGLQTVVEGGTARLEGLVLRGTLATGKSSGSVKLGVKLADLSRPEFDVADLPQSKVARKLDVKCGRPATLELENKGELVAAGPFDADEPLPAVRLLCRDQDGNPCAGTQVTLEMSHGGEDQSEPEPFEGRDGPFETNAKGEILFKRAAFRVNGDALQLGGEVDATLRFVARLDPDEEDEEEDAVEQVSIQLAQRVATEQPELAKLTMHVQGAGVVSCGENFVIEVHGEDTEGSACRVDLAEFGARTWLQRSAMSGEVDADYNAWTQDGDAVKMTLQLSGKVGELDLELPPDHDYSNICDTLTLKLTAGEPAKVVARLLGGAVMNGRELSVDARLVDEHENFVEGYGEGGITWEALQAEDTTQLCVSALKKGAKGVAAELKSSVLTTQPLRTPTEFGLVVAAQFKRAGVVNRLETEQPLRVTINPGSAVISALAVYRVQLDGGDGVEDMEEPGSIARTTQPVQPIEEELRLTADPNGFVPDLAVRVIFEDGGSLEQPAACQLRAKLLDARPGEAGRVLGEVRRVSGAVDLCTPGAESRRAFLLHQDLQARGPPGTYSLELSLSFGNTKGLPDKDLLKGAERAEVKKCIALVIVAGPAFELQPTLSSAIRVVSNMEVPLGAFALLVDACGNAVAHDANEQVELSIRRCAIGSQNAPQMTLAQPAATLHLVGGELTAPSLQLAGEGLSGRYELYFELAADSKVCGRVQFDYRNPADEGRREEATRLQREQLLQRQDELKAKKEEVEALSKQQKASADAVKKARRSHASVLRERDEIRGQMERRRSDRAALGLNDEDVKRLKTAHGIGPVLSTSAVVDPQQQSSPLGQKLRQKCAELAQSLTVAVSLSDSQGQGPERKRKRDFPIDLPSEDNHQVWYELRPHSSDGDGGGPQLCLYKVSSRSGTELAEQLGEQTLSDDPQGEYLLDALQPAASSGHTAKSLFESGRVADGRLSDIAVALVAPWSGADCVALRRPPPAAAAADATAAPTCASLLTDHLAQLTATPGTPVQLLQPASAAESAALSQRVDATTGLMRLGPDGTVHPSAAASGASFLLNRLCCDRDGAEARVTWYRALGPYAEAIVFDRASSMHAYSALAATASDAVLIALENDVGVHGGGGNYYAMFSHGKHSALAKPATSCRLGQTTEADEEQVLSGTADGSKVVAFERAARELSGLEQTEREAADEEEASERDKVKAEEAQQRIEQELLQLRQEIKEIEQLRQQPGTPSSSRGKKRAR